MYAKAIRALVASTTVLDWRLPLASLRDAINAPDSTKAGAGARYLLASMRACGLESRPSDGVRYAVCGDLRKSVRMGLTWTPTGYVLDPTGGRVFRLRNPLQTAADAIEALVDAKLAGAEPQELARIKVAVVRSLRR